MKDYLRRRGVEGYAVTDPTPLPEDAYADNWIAENGLKLLRAAPARKPWFLQVNFNGPHNPMDMTARMEKTVRGRHFPPPNGCTQFDPQTYVAIRQNYSAMVENIDRWLGIYLEELQKRGELENTLIVYSSDHGEMLGDHNIWGKSVPYRPSACVPLVIAGPGVKAQPASQALVSHVDLTATFLEAAGLRIPRDMDSRSLWPLLAGKARTHREFVLSGLNQWCTVWDGDYKLVTGFDPGAAKDKAGTGIWLFHTETDPLEKVNLAPERGEVVERLRRLIPQPPP